MIDPTETGADRLLAKVALIHFLTAYRERIEQLGPLGGPQIQSQGK